VRPEFEPGRPRRPSPGAAAAHQVRRHLDALLDSYSEVLFLKGWKLGTAIMVVTLFAPNVGLSGMAAVLAAYAFARFIHMDPVFLESGFYTYNPLLVGLSLGYLFRLTPLTLFFVVIAGIGAFILTHGLFSASWYYLRLPVLSLPFVVVSSAAYLAAGTYTNLYVGSLYPESVAVVETMIPLWLGGFFRALGAVFFVPSVMAGALIAAALFMCSRILVLLAIGGYYVGTLTLALLGGSPGHAFNDLNTFNFILIAMALGGVFLVPSLESYLLALIAVVTSTLLLSASEVFWSQWGVPVFALPFNVVTLGFLYALKVVEHPLLATEAGTPEEVLDEHLTGALRFPGSTRSLALPFAGTWTVWQAFDGPWTHQGPWRYAYDFVVTDSNGETHRGDGALMEEYLAFRKPVLSPIRGRVVQVVDAHPDNPIGVTDRTNNWGNLVVLRSERGFFVEISHFAEGSIRVREGEWVERGVLLGLCGNSGYSPQPHIHIQVQATEQVGAPTLPFSFVTYHVDGTFYADDTPEVGARVEPLSVERGLQNRVGFVLDEVYRFRVEGCDRERFLASDGGMLELTVRMAPDGTFYLESGRGRLYFGSRDGTFYFYRMEGDDPCLRAFFLALPRLPLAFRRNLRWSDHVPAGTVTWGMRRELVRLARSVVPRLGTVTVDLEFPEERRIVGRVRSGLLRREWKTQVMLHPFRAFQSVRVGNLIMERVDDETG